MTQQDETSRNDFIGNGSTVNFVYEFRILDRTEIIVSLVEDDTFIETIQVIDEDYDVSNVGDSGGGTVQFFVAPPSGFNIVLERKVPFSQESIFIEGSQFPSSIIERDYDKLTQIAQQLRATQDVALKPPTLPSFIDGTLPAEGIQPLNILQINETVDGFVSNPLEIVFGVGPLTPHQVIQLSNISETTFISSAQWAFLGNMDQNVTTTSSVTFTSVNGATNLSDLANLTSVEITQLTNINATVISSDNWVRVSSLDQNLSTTSSPEFANITIAGEAIGDTIIHANQNFNTGSIESGLLSIASATEFNISAGSGIVVDYSTAILDPDITEVSWTAFSNVTLLNMASNNFKSIAIDSVAAIVQKDGNFTELELRDLIFIGTIQHDAIDILKVINYNRKSIGRTDVVTDLVTTIGSINISGNVYSANGVNLSLDKTDGSTFGLSINSDNDEKLANVTTSAAEVLVSMIPVFRDGSGGWTFLPETTLVDVSNFDNGSGTLQNLPGNDATNHRLAIDPRTGKTLFLYGQIQYANFVAASNAIPDAHEILDVVYLDLNITAILTTNNNSIDLSDPADALFTPVSKLGGTGGPTQSIQAASLQTAYDQDNFIQMADGVTIETQAFNNLDSIYGIFDNGAVKRYSVDGFGNIQTDGSVFLNGLVNSAVQLTVTGNAIQSGNPLVRFEDSANIETVRFFEDSTVFDKKTITFGTDDNEITSLIQAPPAPTEVIFKIQTALGAELLSVDNDGQLLVNGAEIESGSGEVVIAYREFEVLDTDNEVNFTLPAPDDPDISALRIEISNIQTSEMGNPPGTSAHALAIKFSTDGGTTFKDEIDNYRYMNITNVERLPKSNIVTALFVSAHNSDGPQNAPTFVDATSCNVFMAKNPSQLSDGLRITCSGSAQVGPLNVNHQYCTISGELRADTGEELEVIDTIKIFTSINNGQVGGPNMTRGSIKVVGIKRGGPSFN